MSDAARQIRNRESDAADALDRSGSDLASPVVAVLCKTVSLGSYPTAASRVYAVLEVALTAVETEGGTVTTPTVAGPSFAVNVGSAVPAAGTLVLCHGPVRGLMLFRYSG